MTQEYRNNPDFTPGDKTQGRVIAPGVGQDQIDSGVKIGPAVGPSTNKRALAYMAAQGANRQKSMAEIQRRIEAVERARSRSLEDIGRDEERGLEGVDMSFESRGLFRSGQRDVSRSRMSGDAQTDRDRMNEDSDLLLAAIERARAEIPGIESHSSVWGRLRNRQTEAMIAAGIVPKDQYEVDSGYDWLKPYDGSNQRDQFRQLSSSNQQQRQNIAAGASRRGYRGR